MRVGVDVGGTFTDGVAVTEDGVRSVKVLTRPREPWISIHEAVFQLTGGSCPSLVVHATTLTTNMLFGQVGLEKPKVALVTNRGFRDILEIGRQNRPELYNPYFTKPEPLVPRHLRFELSGRIGAGGEEVEPLDVGEARRLAKRLCGRVDAVAVVFLHSYVNPSHERMVKRIFEEVCPGLTVVTSHEVDPRPREYERMSTTVITALLKPLVSRYLRRTVGALDSCASTLLVMHSGGGVVPVEEAIERPAGLVESGPAAGVVAAAYIARVSLLGDVIAFDMGGTTAKAALVVGGEPLLTDEYEVGGRYHMGRVVRGSGYPLRMQHVDVVEVSAGGGTIAWVDAGGSLRVGPLSAGADPGPACYGLGGSEPTVTDAHAVLGQLPPVLGGGAIRVDTGLARRALEKLAEKLGVSVERLAEAVIELVDSEMARAVRLASIERGVDPRRMTLLAYGGAGPLHATSIAEELGVERVAVPPLAGVFSAFGLLVADYRYDRVVAVEKEAGELDDGMLSRLVREVIDGIESLGWVERLEGRVYTVSLGVRYRGQAYELEVPYGGSLSEAVESFHKLHYERYGFTLPDTPVIIAYIRVTLRATTGKPRLKPPEGTPVYTTRRVYYPGVGWLEARVYRRESLPVGFEERGPLLIESRDSTILVPPGWSMRVDEHGVVVLERV